MGGRAKRTGVYEADAVVMLRQRLMLYLDRRSLRSQHRTQRRSPQSGNDSLY